MQISLGHFFFSVLLSTGTYSYPETFLGQGKGPHGLPLTQGSPYFNGSLREPKSTTAFECGTCQLDKVTCQPTLTVCKAAENNCITVLDEVVLEGTPPFNVVTMKCASKKMCESPLIQLSFVNRSSITKSTTCCQTDGCTPLPPTIPTMSTVPNGLSCPTCYSEKSECTKTETLNCTGSDTICFRFYTTTDKTTNEGEIRGCTTEAACTALKTYEGPVVGRSFVKDVTCQGTCFALEYHLLSLLLMTLFLLSLH